MAQIFNKSSIDTIAIWMPTLGFNSKFIKPIILSVGVGVENFINIDQPPISVIQQTTINNVLFAQVKQTKITGSFTFNPSSTALVALREIIDYTLASKIAVPGIGLIINPGAVLVDTFKEMVWTTPYSAPNRNKTLSDVSIGFSSRPPTAISLGGLLTNPSVANILNGIGIF